MKWYVMQDIETLGITGNSPIVQIGYAMFDIESGEIKYRRLIDIDLLCYNPYPTIRPDFECTMWWLSQKKESIDSVFNHNRERISFQQAMLEYRGDIQKFQYNILGYLSHASFDSPIIRNLCHIMNADLPYDQKKNCDIRTFELIAEMPRPKPTHVLHNALEDVEYQIKYITEMYNTIKK